jgi:dTDP-4-amino-4,6-dideoxygalactose transaminase
VVYCQHNAHMYYVILASDIDRNFVLDELKKQDINAVFHYVPLHSSPAGLKYCRVNGELYVTERLSQQLIRLPLWTGIEERDQERTVESLCNIFKAISKEKNEQKNSHFAV